ncbi:hypothetical protein C8D88_105408 [Lentzea atacamensis]|uniref:Uncharacterized protein n=1 Tax=Lentzea atacamensis TaxID=531938 RepID=A0A316I7G0_9PSEU|nr:hypothetical protein C8D88_105408 [Lentzea atacamensis]
MALESLEPGYRFGYGSRRTKPVTTLAIDLVACIGVFQLRLNQPTELGRRRGDRDAARPYRPRTCAHDEGGEGWLCKPFHVWNSATALAIIWSLLYWKVDMSSRCSW